MKTLKVLVSVCSVIMYLSAIAFLLFCALGLGTAAVISIGSFFAFLFIAAGLDVEIVDRERAGRQSEYW